MQAVEPLLDPPHDFDSYRNVYRDQRCGKKSYEALIPVEPTVAPGAFVPEPQGLSADGGAAIVRARDKLTPNAASDRWQAYYASEGGLALLCVPPSGIPSGGNCSGGTGHESVNPVFVVDLNRLSSVTNAISEDGSRVYWTDSGDQETGAGKVYLRLNPGAEQSASGCEAGKACTVKVSETKSTRDSRFLMASPDGSKALFEVTEGPLEGDLYRFDAGTGTSELVAGEVVGLAGASEGLSRVYFVSEEALGGEAVAGEPNLYLGEGGEEAFIATLSEDDVFLPTPGTGIPSNIAPQPIFHVARAAADGSALAFISSASLTGYDNADLESGEPASEAYVYEIGSEGPACVSCNPSGARPRGRVVRGTGNSQESLMTAGSLPMADNMLHAPRALSADGERLFFNSFDALLPRDTNGKEDVYEWESAGGKAACEALGAEALRALGGGLPQPGLLRGKPRGLGIPRRQPERQRRLLPHQLEPAPAGPGPV